MKKFTVLIMAALLFAIINGCQKDVPVISQLTDDERPQAVVKPDVYSENGYLVFKDLNILDRVLQSVNSMNLEEISFWENSFNFVSAKTYYSKIFKESELLITPEELNAFRDKYKDVLKWSNNDPEDFSFDYPFLYTNLVQILNKDGLVKIGQSLFKYNKENRIVILDGDFGKLEHALTLTQNTDNIRIFGKIGELKSSTNDVITDFTEDYPPGSVNGEWINWSSTRRMKNLLYCERFTYINYAGLWDGGYRIFLYQRAQKKVIVWVDYFTSYRVGYPHYIENGVTLVSDPNVYTTLDVKPSTTFTIYTCITIQNSLDEPSLGSISRVYPMFFECQATCRGFDYYPLQIDYED